MKYLYLLLFFLSFTVNSQNLSEKMQSVTYIYSGKYYKNWDNPRPEYTRLLVDKNKAIYQIYNVMCLDSLKVKGIETSSDRNKFFSFNNYTIETKNDSITYSEYLAGKTYKYQEAVNFDWSLESETREIYGYTCKKAILNYGGRSWTAWYAIDIAIPYGPYKFSGLPGLIISMYDEDKDFTFELYGYALKEKKPLDKLYKTDHSSVIMTEREKFNELKYKYNALSMGEKSKFRNSTAADVTYKQVDESGNEVEFRETSKAKNLNFIELID